MIKPYLSLAGKAGKCCKFPVARVVRSLCSDVKSLLDEPSLPPLPVTFEDVSKATFLIKSGIKHTPCDYSTPLSEICDANVYLKKDFMQFTGSFKERGARNALMSLTAAEKQNGVVLASAGNHALAMAWHGGCRDCDDGGHVCRKNLLYVY